MVHWLLTKNSKKRPSIEEVILNPLFQKKAVQLRIPLPIRPKEKILPGDALKVTGGCFDKMDFSVTQTLTSDSKPENMKKKLRASDLTSGKNSKQLTQLGKRKGHSRHEEMKTTKSMR